MDGFKAKIRNLFLRYFFENQNPCFFRNIVIYKKFPKTCLIIIQQNNTAILGPGNMSSMGVERAIELYLNPLQILMLVKYAFYTFLNLHPSIYQPLREVISASQTQLRVIYQLSKNSLGFHIFKSQAASASAIGACYKYRFLNHFPGIIIHFSAVGHHNLFFFFFKQMAWDCDAQLCGSEEFFRAEVLEIHQQEQQQGVACVRGLFVVQEVPVFYSLFLLLVFPYP